MHTVGSACCRLKSPVLVNTHHPGYNHSSLVKLKIAGGGWRRGLPQGPLGTPSPRGGRFSSFLESAVIGLSLTFILRKEGFPPAACGSEGHTEGKLRTQMDAAPSLRGCCSPRGRASFLGRTSWLVPGSGLRVPPSATPWGLGEAQALLGSLLTARLSDVLANLLPTRWGPCVCPLCPLPCWQLG